VAVIALSLSGMNGIAATREVKVRSPATRVLLVAHAAHEREVVDGLAAGADGFAFTSEPLDGLLAAIRTVGAGLRHLPPRLRGIAERPPGSPVPSDVLAVLSRREREILNLVIRGWRSRHIARELCVSIKTVETHRSHINRKLHCSSSSDLVRFAADNGLLPHETNSTGTSSGTFVLVVQSNQSLERELARELEGEGYEHADTRDVMSTLTELEAVPASRPLMIEAHDAPSASELYERLTSSGGPVGAPLVFAFDSTEEKPSGLRALACLPRGEAGLKFLTLFERASAARAPRLVDHASKVA
jgi:DNA-binding NarL/FixJ family response regulator